KMLAGNNFSKLNKVSGCIFFLFAVLFIILRIFLDI
ncbi:hypothetical protein L1Z04_18850, partial [Acinetobacter baumannii]|nr:hypothetical protein [Acinetobacter baumannii]